jgi:hypothetical protein
VPDARNKYVNKIKIPTERQWLTRVTLATLEAEMRRIKVRSQPSKWFSRPYLKNTQHSAGRVAQMVEHLLGKCETLSSSPTVDKKKKKTKVPLVKGREMINSKQGIT